MHLKQNDTVIIVSPSGRVAGTRLSNAASTLQKWSLNVLLSENAQKRHHNFSGTKDERLSDLQWALNHPEAKAIFASRGGYGAIHLLDKLDWFLFKKNPKILVGYSDISNLHASVNKMGVPSLHALMPNSFPPFGEPNSSLQSLKKALFDKHYTLEWKNGQASEDAEVEGEVVGGNLSILYSLQGTPYAPDYKGKILFIEEVNEYLYHIDRILHNFMLSGIFSQIKGLIIGDFSQIKDDEVPFGKSLEQIILNVTKSYQFPVAFGLQSGHSSPTLALPLGKKGKLSLSKRHCKLCFS